MPADLLDFVILLLFLVLVIFILVVGQSQIALATPIGGEWVEARIAHGTRS